MCVKIRVNGVFVRSYHTSMYQMYLVLLIYVYNMYMYIVYKAKATTVTSTTLTHYIYTFKKKCNELYWASSISAFIRTKSLIELKIEDKSENK